MKSKTVLLVFLIIMAVMIFTGIVFYSEIKEFLYRPHLYHHALFAHIVSVTLFFANAVVGMLWELRSLVTGRREIIMHTYNTVSWIDARFSSPLIIISVTSGILLSLMLGDIWTIGWLFSAFLLFLLSGLIWIISDIPTQYRIKALMSKVEPSDQVFPEELMRLLKMRLLISLSGISPLIVVFILMVYKPDMEWITMLFS